MKDWCMDIVIALDTTGIKSSELWKTPYDSKGHVRKGYIEK